MPTASEPRLDGSERRQKVQVVRSRSVLGSAIQALVLLLLLAILAAVLLMLFAFASLLNVPNQVAGGVGDRLGSVGAQAAHAVGGAQQALQNATDPNHPPSGLTYDTEFTSLQTWHVGDRLTDATNYVLTVTDIKRRDGADSPDTALYAVIHAELRQPRETRVLGQVIHTDSDPHDYALYKGETFAIGRSLYRVNWISQEERAVAAGTYRNPDAVNAPLKFAYD